MTDVGRHAVMIPPRMVSRQWVRRYLQPRGPRGQFLAGFELWTHDGETRWVYSLSPEAEGPDHGELWGMIGVLAFGLIVWFALFLVIRWVVVR